MGCRCLYCEAGTPPAKIPRGVVGSWGGALPRCAPFWFWGPSRGLASSTAARVADSGALGDPKVFSSPVQARGAPRALWNVGLYLLGGFPSSVDRTQGVLLLGGRTSPWGHPLAVRFQQVSVPSHPTISPQTGSGVPCLGPLSSRAHWRWGLGHPRVAVRGTSAPCLGKAAPGQTVAMGARCGMFAASGNRVRGWWCKFAWLQGKG